MSTPGRADDAPDVYFLEEYGRAASIAENGEFLHVRIFDGAWQVPLIVRTLTDGEHDAITPTFSGIHAAPSLSADQVAEAWAITVETLRDRDIISLVVRGSPLVPQADGLAGLRPISSGRPTVLVEPVDEDTAWAGLRSSCRSRVRKALKNGFTAEIRPATRSDLRAGGDFRRLYELTMQRRSADALYYFGDDYYDALLDGLGPDLLLDEVRDEGGTVVSSTLLMRHGPRLHYHLAGSSREGADMGTNNLMMWTAIRFAVEHGLSQFHIGAGVAGRDSVFRFKSTFGGREAQYDVSGLVVDEAAYQRQVEHRAEACGVTVDALAATSFFPAYRATVN